MNYDDIYKMHQHHQLPIGAGPQLLTGSDQLFRESFMREELLEFERAFQDKDIPEAADALIDLVVVAMGTAVMMGLPWHALWNDVHRANMAKERVVSERAHGGFDLGKPEGWIPPRSKVIVDMFSGYNGTPAPVYTESPKVVCICGSTRFKDEYIFWNRHLTLAGCIVLTVGFFGHAEDVPIDATVKAELDQLHLHKIDMADEVWVLNVDGYIGDSTRAEIKYAESRGIEVNYLEQPGETNVVKVLKDTDRIIP